MKVQRWAGKEKRNNLGENLEKFMNTRVRQGKEKGTHGDAAWESFLYSHAGQE
jgi:hypothetical protein